MRSIGSAVWCCWFQNMHSRGGQPGPGVAAVMQAPTGSAVMQAPVAVLLPRAGSSRMKAATSSRACSCEWAAPCMARKLLWTACAPWLGTPY
jgi:hypothetical protein